MIADRLLAAEWAPQSAVLLTWPHSHGDWGSHLAQVDYTFVELAFHICRFEKLIVSCWSNKHSDKITKLLTKRGVAMERVALFETPSNDSWVRDHGPITVIDQGVPLLLDFTFNGWGGKYRAQLDNAVTDNLHKLGAFSNTMIEQINLVLEGGAIESDGKGTLLTTKSCLLTKTRNPDITPAQLEETVKNALGCERILWLENGQLIGDDTDGHIDTLVRFCDSQTLCYVSCDDPNDPHYPSLDAMRQELGSFRDNSGQPYQLIPLPLPAAKQTQEGERLPATYANFLIINGAVLVPTYDDPADQTALSRLQHCFPDREMIAIDCLPLIKQYGSLHCVTMQLPQGVIPNEK